jgi:hypothetical protein
VDGHGGLVLDYETLLSASASETLRLEGVDAISLAAAAGDEPRGFTATLYTGGVMYPKLDTKSKYQGPAVVEIQGIEYEDDIPVHRNHDDQRPVGHLTDISDDGKQVTIAARFSIDNADSREIIEGRENDFPWKPSIGLVLLEYHVVPAGQTYRANGREFVGPILAVTRSILKEVGIVTMPGDRDVEPIALASTGQKQGSISMSFEDWVASLGLDITALSDEAKTALQDQYNAKQADTGSASETEETDELEAEGDDAGKMPAEDEPEEKAKAGASKQRRMTTKRGGESLRAEYRKTMASEQKRSDQIRTLCAKFGNPEVAIGKEKVSLAAHAIGEGWTVERTELQALRHEKVEEKRKSRPTGPGIHSTSRAERGSLSAMQGALMLRAGLELDDKLFADKRIKEKLPEFLRLDINDPNRQKAMDHAHEFRGMSMIEVCQAACDMSGVTYQRQDKLGTLQAALSTGNVSQLFGATFGAKVLRSYAETEDFTEGWVQTNENPDLEKHIRIRMEGIASLSHNPTGKKADHAERALQNEYAAVNRFAKQMNIDEADFLGDNFGKLKETPSHFGLAAGRLVPELVVAVMLSNPTLNQTGRALFNTTDLSDVASSALDRAGMSAAIARLFKRRDGKATIQLKPTHLLVPPDQMDAAIQILTSVILSNDSGLGEKNVIASYGIKPVVEARLANGIEHPLTGEFLVGSTTTHYLVSAEAHTIEVTFLEGAGRVPIVRTTELVNGEFGLNFDVRHYAGASPLDFRGFVRKRV